MRKNKIEGAIKGAGRKKDMDLQKAYLNVRITEEAQKALQSVPRMQRGAVISRLIVEALSDLAE